MAVGQLTPEVLKAMREHGHPLKWEIATYGDHDGGDIVNVTVECIECGEVLLELVSIDLEEAHEEADRMESETTDEKINRVTAELRAALKRSGDSLSTFLRLEPEIERLKRLLLRLLLDKEIGHEDATT